MHLRQPEYHHAVHLIRAVYTQDTPGAAVGGCLHIVLDDGNVSDQDILWCIQHQKLSLVEIACAKALLVLTPGARELAVEDGYPKKEPADRG